MSTNAVQIAALVAAGKLPPELNIGEAFVRTNHGDYVLMNTVWHMEKAGSTFGWIRGMVVTGGETNRFLWHTSFTDHAGQIYQFRVDLRYARQRSYCEPANLAPSFDLQTCG